MAHLFWVCCACTFLSAAALSLSLLAYCGRTMPVVRLRHLTAPTGAMRRDSARRDAVGLWLAGVSLWLRSHFSHGRDGALAKRLYQAGFREPMALDLYIAARYLGPALVLLAACALPGPRMFWICGLPACTYLGPDLVLQHAIRRRRKQIQRSLSDMLDLLVICVDAGLGLDQASLRVAEELRVLHPAMHDELLLINHEQRAGVPRLDAWQAACTRIQLPDVDAFVNMIMQADRFGTPITRALSTFAQEARSRRTQKAQARAAKATIKIVFPLVLFIFPSIFVVLLGPAVLTMLRDMHGAL